MRTGRTGYDFAASSAGRESAAITDPAQQSSAQPIERDMT
jgi:hypothetical protein